MENLKMLEIKRQLKKNPFGILSENHDSLPQTNDDEINDDKEFFLEIMKNIIFSSQKDQNEEAKIVNSTIQYIQERRTLDKSKPKKEEDRNSIVWLLLKILMKLREEIY